MLQKINKKTGDGDKTGIEKTMTEEMKLKKDQNFWNTATWIIGGLTGKENELIGFDRENLDTLGIAGTKEKGSRKTKVEGSLWIFKGMSGDNRAKERVGCIINNKHKRFISK